MLAEAMKVGATGDVLAQIDLLQQAGYRGNAQAFYELARIYLKGEGVPKAPEAAVGYLTTAVGMEHAESTRVLGWLYLLGTGVQKDLTYGEQLLAKASETSIRARREFGLALTNQRVPHLNQMERGLELLKSAAAAGDDEAARAYSAAFNSGSPSQSAQAPSDQALQTSSPAKPPKAHGVNGGDLRERGQAGDLEAIYQYALNVSIGKIASRDPQFEAYCWYSAAATRGYAPAATELRSLGGVRAISDSKQPGALDQCIAELNASIGGY